MQTPTQDTGWSIIGMESGAQICDYDSLDNFNFSVDTAIPTCPQEGGTLYAFDKTLQPGRLTCTVRFWGDYQKQESELAAIEAAKNGLTLFYIINPAWVLSNYNLTNYSYVRASNSGLNMLEVDLTFQEVKNATLTKGQTQWKPKQASASAPVQEGKKQAETPAANTPKGSVAHDGAQAVVNKVAEVNKGFRESAQKTVDSYKGTSFEEMTK